eukprot:gene17602-15861_t
MENPPPPTGVDGYVNNANAASPPQLTQPPRPPATIPESSTPPPPPAINNPTRMMAETGTCWTETAHPFETEAGDHAETPVEAYQHIAPFLQRIAHRLGKSPAELVIYDPFYCEGRTVALMASIGFATTLNKNEDFYAARAAGTCPEFDVLMTNPPFSGDHIERVHRFAVNTGKPWFILIPQYVNKKAFYLEWIRTSTGKVAGGSGAPKPCYIGPTERPYVFAAPTRRADVRAARSEEQPQLPDAYNVNAGSFQCVWFCCMGDKHQQAVLDWWRNKNASTAGPAEIAAGAVVNAGGGQSTPSEPLAVPAPIGFAVAATAEELPQLMNAAKLTPAEKRWRKKQQALGAGTDTSPQRKGKAKHGKGRGRGGGSGRRDGGRGTDGGSTSVGTDGGAAATNARGPGAFWPWRQLHPLPERDVMMQLPTILKLAKAKDINGARAALDSVGPHLGHRPQFLFPVCKMLQVVGRSEEARATVDRALNVFPGNLQASAARDRLGLA